MVLEVKWTKLQKNWTGHRPIIGSIEVQIRFRYVASFRNDGDRKATAVDFAYHNRSTLVQPYGHRNETPQRRGDVGRPSSCNAFAIATLSSLLFFTVTMQQNNTA